MHVKELRMYWNFYNKREEIAEEKIVLRRSDMRLSICIQCIVLQNFFVEIYEYLKTSSLSVKFFVFVIVIFVLNILKSIFIWYEKRITAPRQKCKYLIEEKYQYGCSLSMYEKRFKEKKDSCEGCKGKNTGISNQEAEERIRDGKKWQYIVIFLANSGKNILPFMSLVYTLCIGIFEK